MIVALGSFWACAPSEDYNATIVSHTLPRSLEPRQIATVEVVVRNTGVLAWGDDVRLMGVVVDGDNDGSRLLAGCDPTIIIHPYENGVSLPAGTSVASGATYTFAFRVQAPDEHVSLKPAFSLVHGENKAFGDRLREEISVAPVQYAQNPFVFPIAQGVPGGDEGGGIFVHDLDNDGRMDYVVSSWREVGAYDHYGKKMWIVTPGIRQEAFPPTRSDRWQSLGGGKAPAVMAGDFDGDGRQEVGYVIQGGYLRILDGASGVEQRRFNVGQAGIALVANLRGLGDRDAVLQYNRHKLQGLRLDTGAVLWTTEDFYSIDKRPARHADLDGDGRDEFCGVNIIGPDGKIAQSWDTFALLPRLIDQWETVDSVVIGDVVPGGKLEVAISEQWNNPEAIVYNQDGVVYHVFNPRNRCCEIAGECLELDPDKVILGNFTGDEALEFFAPSACGRAPWLIDSKGSIIADWVVDQTKPPGWIIRGIEDNFSIDWFGDGHHRLLVKERCVDDGDAAIVDAVTGAFLRVFDTQAMRIYAADVSGDYREEAIIIEYQGQAPRFPDGCGPFQTLQDGPSYVKVYWNEAAPKVERPGYWTRQLYRRLKQNWNHYST
ncbi:MAG: hypothetical protein MUF51_03975 [Vicinamibacteria bacterium]|jgi:hypothetical protein|nr:hypothetical protein [Vicinamibacteria bacterium]